MTEARGGERTRWYDPEEGRPTIEDQIHRLRGYLQALDDGVIDEAEFADQERRVVAAMKRVEAELDDALHAKVSELLLELTAYNVMRLLRLLQKRAANEG